MQRIFTLSMAISCLFITSFKSFGQCATPATGPGASWTFTGGPQGFTTGQGFEWGSDRLNSTNVGAGAVKSLITPVLFLTPGSTTIGWRFDLAGNANVISYTVYAETFTNSNILICSGTTINNGTGLQFSAPVPVGLPSGTNFKLHIDFTLGGGTGQSINIDNFGATPSQASGALPVRFVGVEAKKNAGSLQLTWRVHEEDKLNEYEVERSSNGTEFKKIGTVKASNVGEYNFTDAQPLLTKSFYRIKAIDVDKKYGYSAVISVNGNKASVVFKAFPTLFQKQITIQHDAAAANTRISITAEDGRMIKTVNVAAGSQQTVVDLSSAKSGLYLLRLDNGNGETQTLKVVKQ